MRTRGGLLQGWTPRVVYVDDVQGFVEVSKLPERDRQAIELHDLRERFQGSGTLPGTPSWVRRMVHAVSRWFY